MSNSISPSNLQNGVVTFLDVLGWKGIWQRDQEAINKLKELVESAKEYERGAKDPTTQVMTISDTIVIFTPVKNNEVTEAIELQGEICKDSIKNSIKKGIPVRGATSYGEVIIDGNIYAGKAIDEAASWYEKANWIGVFLTPSANFNYDETSKKKLD